MDIRVVHDTISRQDLRCLAEATYKEMVKAVVDVGRGVLAVGGELHADAEAALLDDGSRQEYLWGINIYLDKPDSERLEYTSLINIRPRQENRSLEIQSLELREKIKIIVNQRVVWKE